MFELCCAMLVVLAQFLSHDAHPWRACWRRCYLDAYASRCPPSRTSFLHPWLVFFRLDTKKDDRICWQERYMLAQEIFEMLFVQRAFLPEKCPCQRVLCRISLNQTGRSVFLHASGAVRSIGKTRLQTEISQTSLGVDHLDAQFYLHKTAQIKMRRENIKRADCPLRIDLFYNMSILLLAFRHHQFVL